MSLLKTTSDIFLRFCVSQPHSLKVFVHNTSPLLFFNNRVMSSACCRVWVWVWVWLRPIDLIISKGCSMAPHPSESALMASLQQIERWILNHWVWSLVRLINSRYLAGAIEAEAKNRPLPFPSSPKFNISCISLYPLNRQWEPFRDDFVFMFLCDIRQQMNQKSPK